MFGTTTESRLSKVEKDVAEIRDSLRQVLQLMVKNGQAAPNNQQIVPANVERSIQVACHDVERRIYDNLNKHLVPEMKKQTEWLGYHTEDTQETLNRYQMDQMMGGGANGLRHMSTGTGAQLHLTQW